jgi:hypothetical protein
VVAVLVQGITDVVAVVVVDIKEVITVVWGQIQMWKWWWWRTLQRW